MIINYSGFFTLLTKEVRRFLKVYHQTVISPAIGVLLLLAVFCISIGSNVKTIEEVPMQIFIASGLIIMAAMQNAFANSSSSLVMAKVMGFVIDYIIPPIGSLEILFAFTIGAIIRGVMVGVVTFGFISLFFHVGFYSFAISVFYMVFACMLLGLLGLACGIVSETFDQMSAVTSYIITPLTFLSGTFYSTNSLPTFWKAVSHLNPFFYIIDGFRYGITGNADGIPIVGGIYLLAANLFMVILVYILLQRGYRLKN